MNRTEQIESSQELPQIEQVQHDHSGLDKKERHVCYPKTKKGVTYLGDKP